MGIELPIVVTISFGPIWLLTDDAHHNLMKVFLETIVPRVEREIGQPVVRRFAVGESMGGYNALLVGLKASQKFSRVAALCPPLSTVSPYTASGSVFDYISTSSTSFKRGLMLFIFGRTFFTDQMSWERNDPVHLAAAMPLGTGPQIYLSCGRHDQWGCFEGAEALVSSINKRGVMIDWHPNEGGHCDIDANSLARFLVQP